MPDDIEFGLEAFNAIKNRFPSRYKLSSFFDQIVIKTSDDELVCYLKEIDNYRVFKDHMALFMDNGAVITIDKNEFTVEED